MIPFLLLIAALVAFLCATFNAPSRINLTALGLSLLTIAIIIGELRVVA